MSNTERWKLTGTPRNELGSFLVALSVYKFVCVVEGYKMIKPTGFGKHVEITVTYLQ